MPVVSFFVQKVILYMKNYLIYIWCGACIFQFLLKQDIPDSHSHLAWTRGHKTWSYTSGFKSRLCQGASHLTQSLSFLRYKMEDNASVGLTCWED